jgi:parallel beta-helix repeat protein
MKRKAVALTLTLALLFTGVVGVQFVTFTEANFLPPPPQLPHVYIRSDGSIEPKTLPIQKVGNIYTFTGNIFNLTLEIQCSNIIIEGAGYTLQGNGSGKGIYVKATGITVRSLKLQKFAYAIVIFESSNNTITGNYITSSGNGIVLHEAKSNLVEDNTIISNGNGLLIYSDCDYNRIVGNNITASSDSGIWCEGTSPDTSDFISIVGNSITDNERWGVLLRSSYKSTVVGNDISQNKWGIELYGDASRDCIIAENNIGYNEDGIRLASQYISEIYHNNFLNNSRHVYKVSSRSPVYTWDNGEEGNYWSDYNGADADGDGIGDTPYIIDEDNKDNYPLMAPVIPVVNPPQTSPSQSPSPSPSQEPISSPEAQTPKPFPTTTLVVASAVSVAVISIGSVVYFGRVRKRRIE